MEYPKRARIAGEIVTEFLPPRKKSNKVIIFCDGAPGMPGNPKTMQHMSRHGYWSFFPRYRGTWESGGQWLKQSLYEDIKDVIDALDQPIKDEWSGEIFQIEYPEIFVVGASFGGPAALFASKHPKVKKVLAIGSVVHWPYEEESETEPISWLGTAIKSAFGEAYRFSEADWDRLSRGEFYNPLTEQDKIDPQKVLMLHSIDDNVVRYAPVQEFVGQIGCQLMTLKKGGHLGNSVLRRFFLGRTLRKYLSI